MACGGAPAKDGGQGPVVCPYAGSAFSANAKFERQPDGELLMAVHLEPPPSTDLTFVDDEPFVQGATVVSHGRIGSALELRMRLDAGVTSPPIALNPPIQCRSGKDGLDVSLAWKTLEADAPVTVTIVDRR